MHSIDRDSHQPNRQARHPIDPPSTVAVAVSVSTTMAADSAVHDARGAAPRLPFGALLALATVVFIAVLTEIMPAGLLPSMSRGLGASESQVGLLVSSYAITTAVTAIPLTAITRRVPRKALLMTLVLGFSAVNALTAAVDSYPVIVVARMVGGMLAGLLWAMAPGYAMRLVPPRQAGRALALAMAGMPVAFAFGLPIATVLGDAIGWRWSFLLVAAVGGILTVVCWLALPRQGVLHTGEGTAPNPTSASAHTLRSALHTPGLAGLLATTAAFVLAHNIAYTYIAPLTAASPGGPSLAVALPVFGVAAIIGVLISGIAADRRLRVAVVVASLVLVAALSAFAFDAPPIVLLGAIALWGVAYGAVPTLFQTAPMRIAPRAADLVQSLVVATWNGSIGIGALLGAIALDRGGVDAIPWPALVLAVVAAVLGLAAKRSFPNLRHKDGAA
ncbi:MFS transporter [Rathayibacter sp. CAU 1779]